VDIVHIQLISAAGRSVVTDNKLEWQTQRNSGQRPL